MSKHFIKSAPLCISLIFVASSLNLSAAELKTVDDFRAAAAKANAANKATIIKETNTNPAMRAAAENAVKTYQEWAVGIDYREDVYKAIKAFADTHPKLTGEDEKLLKETMRDYRRAGLELPPDSR